MKSLHQAIFENNEESVQLLIKQGADLNCLDNYGHYLRFGTPLQLACQNGCVDIVKLLLDYGADINFKENISDKELTPSHHCNQTPLYLAVTNGHLNIVKVLLKNGADIKVKNSMNRTALHSAVCIGNAELSDVGILNRTDDLHIKLLILESLIKYSCDLDVQDLHGNSPLHLATKNQCGTSIFNTNECSFNVFKLLLEAGATVNNQNNCGETSLHLIVSKMYPKITNILLNYGSDPNIQNDCGDTPLHKACRYQQDVNILKLLNMGAEPSIYNKDGRTALIDAIDGCSELVISTMCKSGANISFRDQNNNTALHYAVENLNDSVESKITILTLLKYGSDPNIKNKLGETPLHKACEKSSQAITKILLDFGANLNIQNKNGCTPFHYAAESFIDIFESGVLLELLLKQGDSNIQNKQGNTPLHKVCMSESEDAIRVMLQFGGNPNIQNKIGMTPLHEAIETDNCCEATISLLQYGYNPNISNDNGDTCLHLVCRMQCQECVWAILNSGGNVNAQNCDGNTPMHDLLNNNLEVDIVLYALMSHGADFNIKNNKGNTVLETRINDIVVLYFIILLDSANFDLDSEHLNSKQVKMIDIFQKEMEHMKNETLGGTNITYYHILKGSREELDRLLRNQKVVNAMESENYLTLFPFYKDMIDWVYRHALYRKQLTKDLLKMEAAVFPSLGILPTACVEHIFSFLTEIDLGKLSVCHKLPKDMKEDTGGFL